MSDRDEHRPPSSRDVAGEEFLFHLYRGSEMLQDSRVHDAKAELEQALALQPSDPKGQDLLAIVYFRLGLYPRAIAIYERLILTHPDATTPRINLALCYLKTGQAPAARAELERVLQTNPTHGRAWGYLGLAFQRMGDNERAGHAFAAGGHDAMARRFLEMGSTSALPSLRPEPLASESAEVRKAASEAYQAIDRAEAGFRRADEPSGRPSGTWAAVEPGRERMSSPSTPPPGVAPPPRAPELQPAPLPRELVQEAVVPSAASEPRGTAPRRAAEFARDHLVVFPRDLRVSQHVSGLVLVQASQSFAIRLEFVRAMAYPSGYATAAMSRKMRGRSLEEPLGGQSSPIVEVNGKGQMILAPTAGKRLHALAVEDDALYLREDVVCGFEPGVSYENGRLALGDGDAIAMLQLRGSGAVVAALPEPISALEITTDRGTSVRALTVLGWVGRVVPRVLPPSEAPAGVRGYVAFAGEGMVIVDGR